jgi:hypothetical protein
MLAFALSVFMETGSLSEFPVFGGFDHVKSNRQKW